MPTYVAGGHRLHVAAWRHGLSLYGWREGDAGGPQLLDALGDAAGARPPARREVSRYRRGTRPEGTET